MHNYTSFFIINLISSLQINRPAPDSLTVVIPIRMVMPSKNITFDNNFSVARLRICISKVNGQKIGEANEDSQFFNRLQDIAKANNEFRKCPNILINFLVMKYVLAVLPAKILKFLLLSQSTMVFSNIYGPKRIHTLNSLITSLSNIIFWLPHKYCIIILFLIVINKNMKNYNNMKYLIYNLFAGVQLLSVFL